MKKMLDKTAVDLKIKAQVDFMMLYVCARVISKHITKSTVMSACVEYACTGKPAIFYDASACPYTCAELRQLGEDAVRKAFRTYIEYPDILFFPKVKEFDLPEKLDSETKAPLYPVIARKILKDQFFGVIKLRDANLDNIIKVIFIEREDLLQEIKEDGGKADSGVYFGQLESFAFFKEIDEIFSRYEKLRETEKTYRLLYPVFIQVVKHFADKFGYSMQKRAANADLYDYYDGNMAFYEACASEMLSINLTDFTSEDEIKLLLAQYCEWFSNKKGFKKPAGCAGGCKICAFDIRKCPQVWVKQHMQKLLEELCGLHHLITWLEDGVYLDNFERWLFEKECGYKWGSVFVKE